MPLPQRKSPRLAEYDYNSNGVYFLTFCTDNMEKLLGEIVGGDAFVAPQMQLSEYGKIVEEYILSTNRLAYAKIINYVVMPNHVHLLVQIDSDKSIADTGKPHAAVPHVIATIKRFCTQKIGTNIFQKSFHDHVVRTQEDFLRIWEYIDNNPLRWKIDRFYVE